MDAADLVAYPITNVPTLLREHWALRPTGRHSPASLAAGVVKDILKEATGWCPWESFSRSLSSFSFLLPESGV